MPEVEVNAPLGRLVLTSPPNGAIMLSSIRTERKTYMDFQSLLDALKGDDPPETIYDDLSSAYQSVVDGAAQAKVDHDSAIGTLNEEISRLKAQNFDLLMASQAAQPEPEPEPEPEGGGEADVPSDSDPLFDYERK